MAVTAHWIAREKHSLALVLKAALIAFHHIPGSHTGIFLAGEMIKLLDRAEVTENVSAYFHHMAYSDFAQTGHFTLDNAGNNGTCMEELSSLLSARDVTFHPTAQRIPCFPHIINICVQHILHDYPTLDFTHVDDSWVVDGTTIQKAEYVAALRSKALDHARDVIRTIRRSAKRREGFKDMIVRGNEKNWYKDDEGNPRQLPVVELLLDEPTRWDSAYVMLNRLRTLRKVKLPQLNILS